MLKEKGISVLLLESNCERVCEAADSLCICAGWKSRRNYLGEKIMTEEKLKRVILGDYKIPDTQKTLFFRENDKTLLMEAKKIQNKTSLWILSFQVEQGEVIGFWEEENGICQSLLKILWGEEKIKKGNLWLENEEIKTRMRAWNDCVKQGIGYVERGMHGLFPGLTLERNLTISSVGSNVCQWSDPFRIGTGCCS